MSIVFLFSPSSTTFKLARRLEPFACFAVNVCVIEFVYYKDSVWLLHPIFGKAQPTARDSRGVARALSQRCYPYTRNG